MTIELDELLVADPPAAWRECGFDVEGEECAIGAVRIRFAPGAGGSEGADKGDDEGTGTDKGEDEGAGAGSGLVGWSLRGVEATELDGLATTASERPAPEPAPAHPNGIAAIDHVVAISSDLDRTVATLRAAGLDLRRIREEPTPAGAPRQAFFRLGAAILEVVQEPEEATGRAGGDRPAFFWGLALITPDLERTVAYLGEDRVSEIRPAVQSGRRIATLRRAAGLSVPLALMSP